MMRILYIAVCVLVAAVASVVLYAKDDPDISSSIVRTPLIEGFVSGQGAAEVEARLQRAGSTVVVIEDSKTDSQPYFRTALWIRVLNVIGFAYLGIEGDLRLEFIDGELAATWFYPADAARFEVEMSKQWLAHLSGEPVRLHAATELRSDVDYRGKRYWAWEDANLREKLERWIKNNT